MVTKLLLQRNCCNATVATQLLQRNCCKATMKIHKKNEVNIFPDFSRISQLWFCNRRANLGGLVISWSRTAL